MNSGFRTVGTKRPRGHNVANADEPSIAWAGRVAKPAMHADSLVDYGSGFLRKSCDSCVSSKRRCDGQDPCTRCLRRKKPCHYTERKKCGPRSGQKTTNKMRRLYTAETQLRRRYTETQLQHQHTDNPANYHQPPCLSRAPSSANGASTKPRQTFGRSPPANATPTLSRGELTGETKYMDDTDYSDNGLPHNRTLMRDESGSSWWSLDDPAPGINGALPARARGASGEVSFGQPRPTAGRQLQNQQQHEISGSMHDRSDDGNYGYNGLGQGGGLWSGLRSSGTGSGSGGSAGESWEDDESDEGLGQADEAVAVMLLGLLKNAEDFDGFSDDGVCEQVESKEKSSGMVSNSSQQWRI